MVEERVVDAGEAVAHAALQHDDVARAVDVQDWHPVDRARGVVAGGWIYDVIRSYDQHHVCLRELAVDLVHLQ